MSKAESFWRNEIGVDNVITRKFLSWDDNTTIDLQESIDDLYDSEKVQWISGKSHHVSGYSNV